MTGSAINMQIIRSMGPLNAADLAPVRRQKLSTMVFLHCTEVVAVHSPICCSLAAESSIACRLEQSPRSVAGLSMMV